MAKKFGRIVLTEPAAIVKTVQPAQEVKFKEARQLLCFLRLSAQLPQSLVSISQPKLLKSL